MSENTQIAEQRATKPVRIVEEDGPLAYLMDTARFEHLQRLAQLMASGTLTPKHLRGANTTETMSNCFRVANQAIRWGIDPFAMMDETYVVGGKLAYQGKLVAAVVNARAGLDGRLEFRFSGQGDQREVTVSGMFPGDVKPREISLSVKQARTSNEMWNKDPDQKLIYSGVVKWARRHCPEVVLGVLTDDDLELMHEQPDKPKMVRKSDIVLVSAKEVEQAPIETPEPAKDIELSAAGLPIHDAIRGAKNQDGLLNLLQELTAAKKHLNDGEFDFIKAKIEAKKADVK